MTEKEIGKISPYFTNIGVCVIELKGKIKVGDKIHISGATTDVTMTIDSMQVEHKNVEEAKSGQGIGLKVSERVRENDIVFKVTE